MFFLTLATPFHAIHHWPRRRFTSTGHLSRSRKSLRLATQRSSERFYGQKYARRLTIHNTDGSFADLQKALRARLNISKDEPLVIKQIDGDYALDIETGAFLADLSFLILLTRVRGQRRSTKRSAILPSPFLNCISRSTGAYETNRR